jgi:hypothetical protein
MAIRIFRSGLIPGVYAFAVDKSKLPSQFEPWHAEGIAAIPGAGAKAIMNAIVKDGFFLTREGSGQ